MAKHTSTTVRTGTLFAALGIGAALVAGCTRNDVHQGAKRAEHGANEVRGEANDTLDHVARGGGPTTTPGFAIQSIASARCAREARCNNIGAGHRFASTEACMASVREQRDDDLNLSDCPGGIDQRELSECLRSIHEESCGNPLASLSRLAACRSSDMCLHGPASRNH